MAVTSLNAIPVPNPSLALKRVGACHYLDHPTPIDRWHERVPFLVYPALVGGETFIDLAQAKPEERKNTLIRDAMTLGIPALGTIAATRLLMKPESEILPTTKAALHYIQEQYPKVIEAAQSLAKSQMDRQPALLNQALWGKQAITHVSEPLQHRLTQAPHQLLDVEVGQLIQQLRQADRPTVTANSLNNLLKTTEAAVLERVRAAGAPENVITQGAEATRQWAQTTGTEISQLAWPQRLQEQLDKRGWLAEGATIPQNDARQFMLKNELRLLLPFGEDFDIPANIRSHPWPVALKQTVTSTWGDLKNEAGPFFLTGLASITSGIGSGLLANKVLDGPKAKNRDIVNEGVFQFVANVCMCAVGATAGMATANLLGLTKFNQPLLRLGTIVGGLVAGISLGAASANTISEKWLSPAVDKALGIDEPCKKTRVINANDMVLHLDDLPTALAIAGVQIFKPWIPPFFYISAKKSAQGYRNGEVLVAEPAAKPDRHKEKHPMIQPTTQSPAIMGSPASPSPALMTPQLNQQLRPMMMPFDYPGTLALSAPQNNGLGTQSTSGSAPYPTPLMPAATGLSPLNRLPSATQQPADLQVSTDGQDRQPTEGPHAPDTSSYSTHAYDIGMQAVKVSPQPSVSFSA